MDIKHDLEEIGRLLEEFARGSELLSELEPKLQSPWVALDEAVIAALEAAGSSCSDWSRVLVHPGFDPSLVRCSNFRGDVYLGLTDSEFESSDETGVATGVFNSRLEDCHLQGNCLVEDVGILSGYYVDEGVVISGCGSVRSRKESAYGNGISVCMGLETGERNVRCFAEIPIRVASAMAHGDSRKDLDGAYSRFIDFYVSSVRKARFGRICTRASMLHTPLVHDVFAGPWSRIENCVSVRNSTILSGRTERTIVVDGCVVRDSLLQWGSSVDSLSVVESSVVAEHAHIGRHAKVTSSYIGPDSGVEEGEVSCSLMGPLVGFHHQALLIAAFWPEGRGNVGYGANVGSNHTSRMPDQEIWCGEGTFFGLGCSVKFPCNLSRSPYSIVASGVTTLPQNVSFPFSLINTPMHRPSEEVPPAYNEIIPAWVLRENLYSVMRSEMKFESRSSARRNPISPEVVSPRIAKMMRDARDRLRKAGGKDIYLEGDIPGLGKNFLTEENREAAVDTYTENLRFYALRGLLREVESIASVGGGLESLGDPVPRVSARWSQERDIIRDEYGEESVSELLRRLSTLWRKAASAVVRSREKDSQRGIACIPDYADIHISPSDDPFVIHARDLEARYCGLIEDILKQLGARGERSSI
ncbi:DUF4954 family protein [Candidatus Fermentibacterales bacterium]|nr:DUF4954 family protein [Candidatus Fermentibacterales bacterium]